ncbi:hypothetical protein LTA6_002246 [Microbacterium sp. LTA6]|uniref:hypothetical protein n=1 Tax=Microbacterium sp. LTA6 TaxID=3129771 RepID=UPI00325364AF
MGIGAGQGGDKSSGRTDAEGAEPPTQLLRRLDVLGTPAGEAPARDTANGILPVLLVEDRFSHGSSAAQIGVEILPLPVELPEATRAGKAKSSQ